MASMHARAEAQLALKYGDRAWEWMPNWGKVRNRLSQQNYERHNRRMLWVAMIVPAVAASALVQIVAWWIRG